MRLLIVEDSARLRELLSDRVHDAGWRVDCVETAADHPGVELEIVRRIMALHKGRLSRWRGRGARPCASNSAGTARPQREAVGMGYSS